MGKTASCGKKWVDQSNDLHTGRLVFAPFGGCNDCACVKIFSGIKFFNSDRFLNLLPC